MNCVITTVWMGFNSSYIICTEHAFNYTAFMQSDNEVLQSFVVKTLSIHIFKEEIFRLVRFVILIEHLLKKRKSIKYLNCKTNFKFTSFLLAFDF